MVRPMVHSTKHYVQTSIATIAGGAVLNVILVDAVAVKDKDLVFEVEEGSTVKAIYLEYWLRAGSTTPSSGQAIVSKQIADASNPTAAEMAALGDWDNKKNIFYTTMGLFNDQDADAINIYKGWLKIPRGKQRMGLSDRLTLSVFAATIDLQICGFCTYKEYT